MKDMSQMTLNDWSEYIDVYPYTEDHFQMERALSMMNLMALHMESYNYILESSGLTLDQLDVLMVESGQNDRSYITSQMFYEAAGGVVGGIQKLCTMLANAIRNFFRKAAQFFTGGTKQAEQIALKEKNITGNGAAEQLVGKLQQAAEDAEIQAAVKILGDKMQQVQSNAVNLLERFDAMAGGGGVKLKLDQNGAKTNISVINAALEKAGIKGVTDQYLVLQQTLIQPEYEIECCSVIPDMNQLLQILAKVMCIKDWEAGADEIAYNAFKASMQKDGGLSIEGQCSDAIAKVQAMIRQNKRCQMSEQALQQKMKSSEMLADFLTKMANWMDGGRAVLGGSIVDTVANTLAKDDRQTAQTEEQKKNFSKRYKDDKEIYSDRGLLGKVGATRGAIKAAHYGNSEKQYLMLCNSVYKLIQVMQQAVNIAIKALNEHMRLRADVLKNYDSMVSAIGEFEGSTGTSAKDKPEETPKEPAAQKG